MKLYSSLFNTKLVSFSILFMILCLSIGYSAFTNDLSIKDIFTFVRPNIDIRITSINVEDSSVDVQSNYEEFNVDSISSELYLPNDDSYVTYKIGITNFEIFEMALTDIKGLPDELSYEFTNNNYELGNKICDNNNQCKLGIVKEIYITIKYNNFNENKKNYYINLKFEFNEKLKEVNFISNGDSNNPAVFTNGSTSNLLIYNSNDELVSGTYDLPLRNEYTFLGWNTKADGTGNSFELNKTKFEDNIVVYAQWYKHAILPVSFKLSSYNTNTIPLYGNSRIIEGRVNFDVPVNAINATRLEFDLYIDSSQSNNLQSVKNFLSTNKIDSQFEITSSGNCDVNELAWTMNGIIPTLSVGNNHVVLLLSEASRIGTIDMSNIVYFRMYTNTLVSNILISEVVVTISNVKLT